MSGTYKPTGTIIKCHPECDDTGSCSNEAHMVVPDEHYEEEPRDLVRDYGGSLVGRVCSCGEDCEMCNPHPGERDRFRSILDEMWALHVRKGADYGSNTDPYANVRASEDFGVPPWVGALIRLNDKITRLKSFIRNGNLVNESVEDSIRDIQVYSVIMQVLYEEGLNEH